MKHTRKVAELHRHLKSCADKYTAVAAVTGLETLGVKGPGRTASTSKELRRLAGDLKKQSEHRNGLRKSRADGTNEYLRLMKEAWDWSRAIEGGRRAA